MSEASRWIVDLTFPWGNYSLWLVGPRICC